MECKGLKKENQSVVVLNAIHSAQLHFIVSKEVLILALHILNFNDTSMFTSTDFCFETLRDVQRIQITTI